METRFLVVCSALAIMAACGSSGGSASPADSGTGPSTADGAGDAGRGSTEGGGGSSGMAPGDGSASASNGAGSGSSDTGAPRSDGDTDSSSGSGGSSGSASSSGSGGTTDGGLAPADAGATVDLSPLKQAIVDLRFGMFLHFGILTYTGSWSQANLDITQFNPTGLDPSQWAAAAKAAGMKFGVLTTRHHDGFALWPSAASAFNVGHVPWQNGKGDVVRSYVDAFRRAGLLPAFYYSIWDNTEGVGNGPVTAAQMTYLKTQLTELLTNYGPIPLIVFDGWGWKMGHRAVPFQEIHDLVKTLQPNIMIVDHNGLQSPFDEDLVMYEEPKGTFAPASNVWAAMQGNKINASGGNDWFWAPSIGGLMSVSTIVGMHLDLLGPRHTTFILNCPPNRQGLLDQSIVDTLAAVGQTWRPAAVARLADQGVQNDHPYTPVAAAAQSGVADSAIDGINDYGRHTVWQSSLGLPQWITVDLGAIKPDVGFLGYLPPYAGALPTTTGAITGYAISVSTDNVTFTQVASGSWPADGNLQHATFGPVAARYVQLRATASNGGSAAATEIAIGAKR
ncbi:MAG: alpha-L-fucosidase [Myxococcota bacterium]|nr:alpha-L-fucosidase [Myxococcota bacterium]